MATIVTDENGGASMAIDQEPLSPRQQKQGSMQQAMELGAMNNGLDSLNDRADPDAQATVTDFLEFTEYLPADMTRSLTLIQKLDETYIEASTNVHNLTRTWGQLPTLAPEERPQPVQLRADISDNLKHALDSRVYSYAEAKRMKDNINRHYNRIKTIRAKLQTMLENYPAPEDQKSPVVTTKPAQATRATKVPTRIPGGGEKGRRPHVPRITVPGEVLAPHEVVYGMLSDDSDSSSEEDKEPPGPRAGASQTRGKPGKVLKVPKPKVPKNPTAPALPSASNPPPGAPNSTTEMRPPPPDAVKGSADAPWFQLTPWELAKLRKRMKKNSAWAPSDTMIAKELKTYGRGWDPYHAAQKKAEEEGKPFKAVLTVPVVDDVAGTDALPQGAVSVKAAIAAEGNFTNKGLELNKMKKLKKEESLAQRAAEEAEEGARKMRNTVDALIQGIGPVPRAPEQPPPKTSKTSKARQAKKRKRDSATETDGEKPKLAEGSSQQPQAKRNKTETPVPVPQQRGSTTLVHRETPVPPPQLTPGSSAIPQSTTPVPVPMPGLQGSSTVTRIKSSGSPAPIMNDNAVDNTVAPVEAENTAAAPAMSPKKATTPNVPVLRETRQRDAKKEQAKEKPAPIKTSKSRTVTPTSTTPATAEASRRPSSSRGAKATSQEPQPSLAADRPRRASTARNTPAPEPRQTGKRAKRPAPGIVTRTTSGGNSAITKRKAAPKKKKRGGAPKRERGHTEEAEAEIEVDDDGNPIDPNEIKYCSCHRVSFGTMIACENDTCKYEWFHLDCVGMAAPPAKTTKWFCPECRVLLNIGEKGEISARGVRK